MTAKVGIVKRLGEQTVLLPALIAEALNANDRVKLRMSMLQVRTTLARSEGLPYLAKLDGLRLWKER